MPVPSPHKGESQDDFIGRCMGNETMVDEYDQEQRAAICFSQWRDRDKAMPLSGHAYSVLHIKRFDNEQRIIEGIASTPEADRVGDVVLPRGARFSLPLKLLWQHDPKQPIGHVTWAEAREDGIPFRAKIETVEEPGRLKDRLDEAWQSIKSGLVSAVSIGFRAAADKVKAIKGGFQYDEWHWVELSCVTIPANESATITTIRSIDQALRAVSGTHAQNDRWNVTAPPVSGHKRNPAGVSASRSLKVESRAMPMTNADRMKGLEEKRAAEMAAIEAIQEKINEENRTKDEAEQEKFDGHAATIKSIDRELSDCRLIERELIAKAKPPVLNNDTGAIEFSAPVIQVSAPKLPQGIAFIKMLACQLHARQFNRDVIQVARQYCGQWPQIEQALVAKAAVAIGNTTSSTWAGPLVYAQNVASEFVEYLLPMTFFGKIPGFTRVPFNSRVVRDTAAIAAQWVGEAESKPVAAGAFDTVTLAFNKIALIIAVTQELAKFSNPAVETWARDKLADAIAKFQDEQFITPSITATGNRPASITNGADSDAASGTDSTALVHDIRQILKNFQDANIPTDNLVILMQPQLASGIGSIYTTLGVRQFSEIDNNRLQGFQIITSANVPVGYVIALHPPSIAIAEEGLDVSASTEASVQLNDNPTAGDYQLVSAFQNNLLFVRAEKFVTWKRLRNDGVFYLTNAAYGGSVT